MNKDGVNKLLKRIETTSLMEIKKSTNFKNKKSFCLYLKKDYDLFLEKVAVQMGTSKTQLINKAIILFIESFDKLFYE